MDYSYVETSTQEIPASSLNAKMASNHTYGLAALCNPVIAELGVTCGTAVKTTVIEQMILARPHIFGFQSKIVLYCICLARK